ncbi:Glutaredoxin [Macleaya cordata]|uniref:Glutaredoxin n=1 Tax=Macleaya cordata TaxID=56857 RepID=A0A200Q6F4_MACCD|nr:Glutaredoxin [Macleaya cordata]
MGCVSSKLFKNEFHQEAIFNNGDYKNHVVSLTSSTYGLLKLDSEPMKELIKDTKLSPPKRVVLPPRVEKKVLDEPEIINAWELMKDLDEEISISTPAKKSPKSQTFLQTPAKFFNQINSPRKQKKFSGKENKPRQSGLDSGGGKLQPSPQHILKPLNSSENVQRIVPTLKYPLKNTPVSLKTESFRFDSRVSTSSRRSLSPLFDPELLASFEKELNEQGEQIKKMVSPKPRRSKSQDSESMLELFEKKCPPGGENAVVIYTTTLRGIRKTFEDCNAVRSIIESHQIYVIERDISMDSGFREELRVLMGKKEVRVPLVFVKGRLIGGADEVVKMEEEGKLGILFDGIARASGGCEGCAGVRFVMCMDCSGSCKVLDEEQKKMVKCGECNENGLIQCPICC